MSLWSPTITCRVEGEWWGEDEIGVKWRKFGEREGLSEGLFSPAATSGWRQEFVGVIAWRLGSSPRGKGIGNVGMEWIGVGEWDGGEEYGEDGWEGASSRSRKPLMMTLKKMPSLLALIKILRGSQQWHRFRHRDREEKSTLVRLIWSMRTTEPNG
jgi:hypothetical protein